MKFLYFLIFSMIMISTPLQPQILNGGFEQWAGGEPANWLTNNVRNPEITLIPITQTTDAHSGSYALRGKVITTGVGPITYSPKLQSGTFGNLTFPYSSQPEYIKGYYQFHPVGGDKLDVQFIISKGEQIVAIAGETFSADTDTSYAEAIFRVVYRDSLSIPDRMYIIFQILPGGDDQYANVGTSFIIDDFPSLVLVRPPEERNGSAVSGTASKASQEERVVFIAGEQELIKWEGAGAQNVDIKYSEDDGKTFNEIVSSYPADSNQYAWDVPDELLTRKARIRITETESPDTNVTSVQFSIKPWQFTRIDATDEFELFQPSLDGWSFGNNQGNMWPASWYQQFDYEEGTDPYTGEPFPEDLQFAQARSSDFMDWVLFVDVFRTVQCYYPLLLDYRARAVTRWAGIKRGWPGSCFGFAVSSLIAFYHKSGLLSVFPELGDFQRLGEVSLADTSRLTVNHYFTHQFGREVIQYRRSKRGTTPRQLLQNLKNMLRRENGDGRPLGFSNVGGSGGHAVVPYKLERIGESHSFRLLLYDSRSVSNPYIRIDSLANTWQEFSGLGWPSASKECYLLPLSGAFLATPTMQKRGHAELAAVNSLAKEADRMTVYNTSDAEIVITATTGEQIGYRDSVAFNEFEDANPIIPMVGGFYPPIGYDIPKGDYSLEISSFLDSVSYVYFLSDSNIFNYGRTDALENESDILYYSENGLRLINPDQTTRRVNLESIILTDSTSEKAFAVSNVEISGTDSIHVMEENRGELLLKNYGARTDYDLRVKQVSGGGKAVFRHATIQLEENSTHRIKPVWDDLDEAPMKIYIDNGHDGTTDDSLQLSNQTTKLEDDENSLQTPNEYKLAQNYPNPFNQTTMIRYNLPENSEVTLEIYNILGQKVITLIDEIQTAGEKSVVWNGRNQLGEIVNSGIYIYRMKAGDLTKTKRMLFLK
ncbi:T9SS type A sorting domain-containing protein [candidate division KSB1 bacterium]|nr:T9SS type A sorting domain-containing protein [candidate division KSB1 bacterium]